MSVQVNALRTVSDVHRAASDFVKEDLTARLRKADMLAGMAQGDDAYKTTLQQPMSQSMAMQEIAESTEATRDPTREELTAHLRHGAAMGAGRSLYGLEHRAEFECWAGTKEHPLRVNESGPAIDGKEQPLYVEMSIGDGCKAMVMVPRDQVQDYDEAAHSGYLQVVGRAAINQERYVTLYDRDGNMSGDIMTMNELCSRSMASKGLEQAKERVNDGYAKMAEFADRIVEIQDTERAQGKAVTPLQCDSKGYGAVAADMMRDMAGKAGTPIAYTESPVYAPQQPSATKTLAAPAPEAPTGVDMLMYQTDPRFYGHDDAVFSAPPARPKMPPAVEEALGHAIAATQKDVKQSAYEQMIDRGII